MRIPKCGALLFICAVCSWAATPDWKIGKVLDSTAAKTYFETGSTSEASGTIIGGDLEVSSKTKVQTRTILATQLLIVGAEFAYTINDTRVRNSGGGILPDLIGNSVANRHHGCRFIVGDNVKYYQEKAELHVIDADGKECKTEILRQERVTKPGGLNEWLERAGRGDPSAQNRVGMMYAQGNGVSQDYSESVRWLRKASDQGFSAAQYNLSVMYERGNGVPHDDKEASRLCRLAADQGYANAQTALGLMYYRGQGVPQDYAEAVEWARKAADQGFAVGLNNLAFMYFNGQGVPQSYPEAARLYRKAADQGYATAQNHLGLMYLNGQGVTQDFVVAHMWVNLAVARASSNDQKAFSANRDEIAAKMTPTQIEEAQRLARDWKPQTKQ